MTYPVSSSPAWASPEAAAAAPPPISPVSAGQVYSSAYVSAHMPTSAAPQPPPAYQPEPEYQPGPEYQPDPAYRSVPFEGYGPYSEEPAPYGSQSQPYGPSGYAPGGPGDLDPYSAAQYDSAQANPAYSYDEQYAAQAGPAPEFAPADSEGGSRRDRFTRLPRNPVLAAVCVALLLASATLLAMYVSQMGKASDATNQLSDSQANVKQRDAKIQEINQSLAEAKQKIGSGTDELNSSQTQLQKLTSDATKANKDLETANKDKQSLTGCLKALTEASNETDPTKRAELTQRSQQACARSFELAGIKTS
ncbi:MAG: hypothetical protein DLM55_11100 [Acidimicrobiales bacterium]|nr:MAG: hypothetical protein DLM55_11100 [Acidimicrobiales bacterium]